ncbi:MAG: hypothetical protein JWO93_2742 [Micrococcaceae bacterium]|nr:hypothetical protein [Micrococcaceae bacterium]
MGVAFTPGVVFRRVLGDPGGSGSRDGPWRVDGWEGPGVIPGTCVERDFRLWAGHGIGVSIERMILLPPAAYRLSGALAIVALVASTASFLIPDILGGPPVAQGNLRGTALVIMVLAVPAVVAAMFFTRRDSARALVVWLGALAYIIYQSVLFLFATPFNRLFLIYVAMLSLAFWSIAVIVRKVDIAAFRSRFDRLLPVRGIAVYVAVLAVLNTVVWLRTVIPAVLSEQPASFLEGSGVTTNPVFVQDLAIWLPVLVCGAWWLWNRQPLGELVVGAMLVMLVLEAIGVATDQWFGASADPGTPFASMDVIPLFLLLAVGGSVPLFFHLKHLDTADRSTPVAPLTTT